MHWRLIALLGSWGLVMGLLTSLVGISPMIEPFLWFGAYAIWIPVIVWRRAPAFETGLAASLLSGVLVGPVQAALMTPYLANNPGYAELFEGTRRELAIGMVSQGVVAGFVFGLGVGGLTWLVARVTGRTPTGPGPQA